MPTRRQRRVSELIHRELSLLLQQEVSDPRLAEVTITAVEVTPDLMLARVFFTTMGEDSQIAEVRAGLERATGFIRSQLAGRVLLRQVPQLAFEFDRSAAYGRHIDELLDQIAQEPHAPDEQPD